MRFCWSAQALVQCHHQGVVSKNQSHIHARFCRHSFAREKTEASERISLSNASSSAGGRYAHFFKGTRIVPARSITDRRHDILVPSFFKFEILQRVFGIASYGLFCRLIFMLCFCLN